MIDLSFLTEEEQEKIMAVLNRDSVLKKTEEERIKKLQENVQDKNKDKLKFMTGEWFYEAKSQRHKDRIHGSDIIRASMKQRRSITLLELTGMWTEKPSFVNSGIRDVFVPPELSGLIDEPSRQPKEEREKSSLLPGTQQDGVALPVPSPARQRQNPFNSVLVVSGSSEERDSQLTNGTVDHITASEGDTLPPPETAIDSVDNLMSEGSGALEATFTEQVPMPQKQTALCTQQGCLPDNDGDFSISSGTAESSAASATPKGILKQSSSGSSCDSPVRYSDYSGWSEWPNIQETDSQNAAGQEGDAVASEISESIHSLDRKQVRFSPEVSVNESQIVSPLLDDQELGEHDLLDAEFTTFSDEEGGTCKLDSDSIMDEGSNSLTQSSAVGEMQQDREDPSLTMNEADFPPSKDRASPTSQSQNSRLEHNQEEEDTGQQEQRAASPASQVSTGQGSVDQKGHDEAQTPVRMALKRISARPMSFSKSLEDITSQPTISTTPATPASSFSDPEQMKKMSASVPAFLQEENDGRDSDSTSESSFRIGRQMRTGSTCTNLSISSGMASLSSVTGSVMSIYSGEYGNVEVRGTIQFAINYVQKLGEFHIFVVQCRELAVADPRKNRSDPYVKCYLLPDKTKLGKRKTTVKKKTLNPTYNEILRYRIDMEILKSQTLNVSVWHNDTFGRNSFLGEVDVDLSEWDFRNTQMNDFTLKPKSHSGLQPTDYRGEMSVALRFLPTVSHSRRTPRMGEVQILVKECKNLPIIRGAIDPFVKCNVLPDTSRKGRQKTRVVKRTADPVFNQTMVYDGFQAEDLREACVELTVWDHDRLNNHFLGGVRLSLGTGRSYGAVVDWMDSNAQEAIRSWFDTAIIGSLLEFLPYILV
ncbi:hypothetical protein MATL_G00040050 [Megalops atlanticus]|uniref:Synaptotagmin-like protein 2 n=1 Tax=Megalops atlanticus TaxID=7932 RepID=A0A9D3Q8H7_MEGAT|nr:hypothetical protein MATL_G00040050 [Megalops atlanticus]